MKYLTYIVLNKRKLKLTSPDPTLTKFMLPPPPSFGSTYLLLGRHYTIILFHFLMEMLQGWPTYHRHASPTNVFFPPLSFLFINMEDIIEQLAF